MTAARTKCVWNWRNPKSWDTIRIVTHGRRWTPSFGPAIALSHHAFVRTDPQPEKQHGQAARPAYHQPPPAEQQHGGRRGARSGCPWPVDAGADGGTQAGVDAARLAGPRQPSAEQR